MALLAREMQFARLELRQIAATLTGAAVGIGLAVADKGAWAIVGQILAEATMSTLLLWVALALAAVVHLLDGEPAAARRLRRQRLRGERALAVRPQPSPAR